MKLEPAEHAGEIESKLMEHPGVRQAAVLLWKPDALDNRLVAYVVPDNEYLDRTLAGADDESRRIQNWRKTYDLTQSGKSNVLQPDFNILGWNSSYTRLAIPEDQMREWVDLTVQEILRFEPSEVLELGCGAGLLLLRLARRCKRYIGVDNAPMVLEAIKRQMHQLGGEWTQVELLERAADDFEGLSADSFDTLVINSAAQYFPSVDYLVNILDKAVRVVKPGGRIFLGDLRSLVLQGPFATSVELFHAPPAMGLSELRERVRKRVRFDEQLVLSPSLFLALRQRWPQVSRVELQPRRGRFDNEMNRYRFNAILHLGAAPTDNVELAWTPWPKGNVTLEFLALTLRKQQPELLGITNVPNRRVDKDVLAFAELQTRNGSETVGSFKKEIHETANQGVDPQDLWSLGEQFDYDVQISWAASRLDGSYDVVLRRKSSNELSNGGAIAWPEDKVIHDDLALHANAPIKSVPREKLRQQLREYCEEHLPEAIRPNDIVLVNALTLAPDGIPDRQALPSPDGLYH
jgi:SAM-dependent methyltransferase